MRWSPDVCRSKVRTLTNRGVDSERQRAVATGAYAREVPAELERIVSKALRKDRDESYQTVKDLILDLRTLKQSLEFERSSNVRAGRDQ